MEQGQLGQKAPFKLRDIWALLVRLQMEGRVRELALFNLGIDSKLRGCDLLGLKVRDVPEDAKRPVAGDDQLPSWRDEVRRTSEGGPWPSWSGRTLHATQCGAADGTVLLQAPCSDA